MSAEYWIDTDWTDPHDPSSEQCVYLYCPTCSWRSEACGFSLKMLGYAITDHEKDHHG